MALEPVVSERMRTLVQESEDAALEAERAWNSYTDREARMKAMAESQRLHTSLLRAIGELEAENAALREELAVARKDTERLDWLDASRPNAMGGSKVSLWPWSDPRGMTHKTAIACEATFRAAIDASRTDTALHAALRAQLHDAELPE